MKDIKKPALSQTISRVMIVIQLLCSILFGVIFANLGMFPTMYLMLLIVGLVILLAIPLILQASTVRRVFAVIISMIVSCILLIGSFYLWETNRMLEDITVDSEETRLEDVSLIVLSDDAAQSINDTKDSIYGIQTELDRENTDSLLQTVEDNLGCTITTKEYDSLLDQVDALYNREIGVMVMNEKYRSLVLDTYDSFSVDTRVISSYSYEKELPEQTPAQDTADKQSESKAFCVFLSGIDTYGDVTAVSRSDVNIIAAVNPETRQMLLLTTPRDYYVELPFYEGCMDKLTHAGIYGIDVSMKTLENLYGVPIDHYARINFTGFQSVVDAIGGVDVYCQIPFSAGGFSYSEGYNHVDGVSALSFVRERHSFAEGDIQRGRNQMEMIKAIVNKMMSPSILTNYASLMSSVSDFFTTNMSKEQIADLVKAQLDDTTGWNIVSYNVSGSGTSSTTYSMGSREVYIMIPDESTVETAKELLRQVYEGETISAVQ